jgi:hypothetical protein
MEVAGQKQVGAGASELLHSHPGSTDQMFLAVALRQLEWMVRHDDPHDIRRRGRQARGRSLHLSFIQSAAAAQDDRSCTVQTDHDHFFIDEYRLEIASNVVAITGERTQEPRRHVVERHIVIARDDELGTGQLLKKGAGLNEFASTGALSEIAGNRDQVWCDRRDGLHERRDEPRIDTPKMQVGEMDEGAHLFTPEAGGPATLRAKCDSAAAWSSW